MACDLEAMKLLFEAGALVEHRNHAGHSALDLANQFAHRSPCIAEALQTLHAEARRQRICNSIAQTEVYQGQRPKPDLL